MPQVHPNVEDYTEEPEEGSSVDLVVGLGEMSEEDLKAETESFGGEYQRELSFGFHLVTVPETEVSRMCELEGIETIEADEGVEDFEGTSQSHRVSDL